MGKRHQASRRRSYGRRQHEIRERFDRRYDVVADVSGIEVFEVAAFDAPHDDPFGAFELPGGSARLQYALGK